MNIKHVITNLERTIDGKEKLLESMHPNNPYTTEFMDEVEKTVHHTTIEFLRLNIIELRTILTDLRLIAQKPGS